MPLENTYNNKLNEFITTSLKSDDALKLNNFEQYYVSFAQVTAGKENEPEKLPEVQKNQSKTNKLFTIK